MQNQASVNADLETLRWFGAGGMGWIASGRPAMGVTVLVVRFVLLGGGVISLLLLWLAAADACVYEDAGCAGLQGAAILVSLFWFALWLAFPVLSGALLRAANGQALWVAVPRALFWIGIGLLAFFLVPSLLQLVLV